MQYSRALDQILSKCSCRYEIPFLVLFILDGSDVKTFQIGAHHKELPRFFLKPVEQPTDIRSSAAPSASHDPFAARPDLKCPLCHLPFRNVITTPCCIMKYCNECLRQAISSDVSGSCPMCRTYPFSVDDCKPNQYVIINFDFSLVFEIFRINFLTFILVAQCKLWLISYLRITNVLLLF